MRLWDIPFSPENKNGCKIPLLHLWSLFRGGGGGGGGGEEAGGLKWKITHKLRSTTHPASFNPVVVRFV